MGPGPSRLTRPDVVGARVVPRPRLLERLSDVGQQPVIVAAAPAGFVTSVLRPPGAGRQRVPMAWLRVDPGDDEARTAKQARRIHERTAGWPLAVSMQVATGTDRELPVTLDPAVGRHPVEQVLTALPDTTRRFVEATEHFIERHLDLCESVTRDPDARRQLG